MGAEYGEEDGRCDERYVFIEEVLHQGGNSPVVPVAVHEQHSAKESEPGKSKVGTAHCLPSFFTHNS